MMNLNDDNYPFPDRNFESGYLIIRTTYTPDSNGDDDAEAEANALVARAVRRIVENRESRIKGAVVETETDGSKEIYILVSVRASAEAWEDDNPLEQIRSEVLRILTEQHQTSSSIKVDSVDVAKKRETATPTGLEGPP